MAGRRAGGNRGSPPWLRGVHHRRDDLAIAGAAAQNAAQRVLHLGLGRARVCCPAAPSPRPAAPACRCRIAPRHGRGRRPAAPTAGHWRGPRRCVTAAPATEAAGIRQAQTGSPSTSTVQAPQSPASQPTLVPVSRSSSRSTGDSRRSGGTSTETAAPLTSKAMSAQVGAFRCSCRPTWLCRHRVASAGRSTARATISRAASSR